VLLHRGMERIAMAYSFLSRFRIKDEMQDEFVHLALEMEELAKTEPGVLHFKFFRLEDPGMFAVHESFTDESAAQAHMDYPQNKPLIDGMVACMEGTYVREMLNDLTSD
jgi:autoinducer 2-degrading protein